eukprot:jgi/Chrzof1/2813/UNPLg00730.t1
MAITPHGTCAHTGAKRRVPVPNPRPLGQKVLKYGLYSVRPALPESRSFQMVLEAPRCFQMFLDVSKCVQKFLEVSRCF